jgi:hypothetical protein
VRHWWWRHFTVNRVINDYPDRVALREEIFPSILALLEKEEKARILWVGCKAFTKDYYGLLESGGAECWTLDIDPAVRRWGRRERHVVGDLLALPHLFPQQHFDAILCNGVFGFGIDTPEAQASACAAMAQAMQPGRWMLLGWDTHKIADPLVHGIVTPWFDPAELPGFGARRFFDGSTHVYDFLVRRGMVAVVLSAISAI